MRRVFPATSYLVGLMHQTAKASLVVAALAVAGLAVPVATAPALAQDETFSEEHLRIAARYAELSGANRIYVNALNAQRRDIIRTLASTNPDIGTIITEVTDAAYLEMAESTGPLFEDIAEVYARRLSQEDLVVIVDFFQSDVGQRFLQTRREADQEVLQVTVTWGDAISESFLARVRALLAERGIEM